MQRAMTTKYECSCSDVPEEIQNRMCGCSWKEGCPVSLSDLSYITVTHWGYDDNLCVGHMIVHAYIALEMCDIFRELFDAHFPIERMEIMELYDGDDDASMTANNSSSFNFRPNTTTPNLFSNHSYGLAVDINPLVNPYVRGDLVLPAAGADYVDRSQTYTGMITDCAENVCYQAFASRGYEWGGSWPDRQDYQHFHKDPSLLHSAGV